MTRYMHASIIATDVAKPHLPKRKTKKCIPYVSVLPFQPRSFPSQFRPEGRWLAWSDNSETPHPGGHAPLAHGIGGDGETYL